MVQSEWRIKKELLKKRVEKDPFDQALVDEVLVFSDPEILSLALDRHDCPKELIAEIYQSPGDFIRIKVARHANTPQVILRQMINDGNPVVAGVARSRLSADTFWPWPQRKKPH